MKRQITILILLLMLLGLSGCRSSLDAEIYTDVPTYTLETDTIAATTTVPTVVDETVTVTVTVTEPPVTEPAHEHVFSDATCTSPGICDCGETSGNALGHVWEDATCVSPKTCSACGATEGNTASHNYAEATCSAPKTCNVCGKTTGTAAAHTYANGSCVDCGKEEPSSNSSSSGDSDTVWIPTKGGKKYHAKASCSNMIDPDEVTKNEAEDLGFEPCKRCYK